MATRRRAGSDASVDRAARDRGRVGVVGVVEHQRAAGRAAQLHAPGRQGGRAECAGRVRQRHVAHQRGGEGGGGVEGHVRTGHGQRHLDLTPWRGAAESGTGIVGQHQIADEDVGLRRGSERQRPGRGAGGHRRHAPVVGVEDGDAAGRQGLDQFGLGLGHALDVAQAFGVGGGDERHDPDLRPADLAQARDLARTPHAHLQHQGLRVVGRLQERDRQALLVVVRAVVGRRPPAGAQRRGGQVLDRGLADRAGDADDPIAQAL